MRAFSLKSKIAALATALALTATAVAPAQARSPDWWAHHRGGGHHMRFAGHGEGFVGRGYRSGGYYGGGYGGGYYNGGYYNGGYYDDGGFPFALGALGIITGAAIAAERPYASIPPGCLVYRRIYNRYHHVIGHRWVDVCY